MTAAALPSGTAPRPAASEDPLPLAQSGLNSLITLGGRRTGAAPVTTTSGVAPPDCSSQIPRSTSRTPSTSTSALGRPSRDPAPAASSTPATGPSGDGPPGARSAGARPAEARPAGNGAAVARPAGDGPTG